MNNFHIIKTSVIDGVIKLPTKQLFDAYDTGKTILLHTEDGDVSIPPLAYFLYDTEEWYSVAVFKNPRVKILSEYQVKLLSIFHIEWINALWEYLNGAEFLDTLKKVAEIRKTQIVSPNKEDVFKSFTVPIKETIIPSTLTSPGEELWTDFIQLTQLCYVGGSKTSNKRREKKIQGIHY